MDAIIRSKEQHAVDGDSVLVVIVEGIRAALWIDVNDGDGWHGDSPYNAGVGADRGDEAEGGSCGQEALK